MSPRYERRSDLRNEKSIARIFCQKMQCKFRKIKEIDDYSPDVSFWRDGKRVAIGEIKARTCASGDYETYLISKSKIDSIFDRWSPLPVVLIVSWTDGIRWLVVTEKSKEHWIVRNGGRQDRDDPKDIEECYHIPISEFTELNE